MLELAWAVDLAAHAARGISRTVGRFKTILAPLQTLHYEDFWGYEEDP